MTNREVKKPEVETRMANNSTRSRRRETADENEPSLNRGCTAASTDPFSGKLAAPAIPLLTSGATKNVADTELKRNVTICNG